MIGSITVFNDNDAPVDDVAVSEAIDDPNATCIVSGGDSTIPPVGFSGAGHTTFQYSCSYSAAPENANETSTATISWPAQTLSSSDSLAAGSTTAEAALDWSDPDDAFYLDSSVDVSDSLAGSLGTLSYTDPDSTTYTYPFTFDAPWPPARASSTPTPRA